MLTSIFEQDYISSHVISPVRLSSIKCMAALKILFCVLPRVIGSFLVQLPAIERNLEFRIDSRTISVGFTTKLATGFLFRYHVDE